MKKIDVLILRTIFVPFLATLLVGNFVFLMAIIFRKMDELIGKGLGPDILAEVFFYSSFTVIPISLPLAVLISSVMAMGNLGEHYELAALKSSGVSLLRVFRPLIVAAVLMSVAAFYFSNNVAPYSTLKLSTLLWDISKKKPALLLQEGVFLTDFSNLVMKIDKKGDEGMLYGVVIQDHSKVGQTTLIKADSARMVTNGDTSRFMTMILMDGNLYEDKELKSQYTRFAFKELVQQIDMSSFEMGQTNEDAFKESPKLKHVGQLSRDMDTIRADADELRTFLESDLNAGITFYRTKKDSVTLENVPDSINADFAITKLTKREQVSTISTAKSRVRNIRTQLSASRAELEFNSNKLRDHKIEWYKKFALAFSCIVLFFIGAPMGALVRKGGFGMPIVVSIALYVIYYVINLVGIQFAKKGVLSPMLGLWLSTIVLFPFAIYLTRMAVQDSRIFNFESIQQAFGKLKERISPSKKAA